jgi:hypothetical protein
MKIAWIILLYFFGSDAKIVIKLNGFIPANTGVSRLTTASVKIKRRYLHKQA